MAISVHSVSANVWKVRPHLFTQGDHRSCLDHRNLLLVSEILDNTAGWSEVVTSKQTTQKSCCFKAVWPYPVIPQDIQFLHQLRNDYILLKSDISLSTARRLSFKGFVWVRVLLLPSPPPDGSRSAGHCCCSQGTQTCGGWGQEICVPSPTESTYRVNTHTHIKLLCLQVQRSWNRSSVQ